MKLFARTSVKRLIASFVSLVVLFGVLVMWGQSTTSARNQDQSPRVEGESAFTVTLPLLSNPLPLEKWPKCAPELHDPTQWHSLMNRSARCHYDHEHKDNPHKLDDVFGTQIYEWAGGSISYPWQTGDGHGENEHKHESYGWIVLRDLPPALSDSEAGDFAGKDAGFIKHLRIQAHLDLNALGAPTRFHSSYIEAMVCYKQRPYDCGIVRYGGHQDYGELRVDGNWVPLPNDPDNYADLTPPAVPERDYDPLTEKRMHSASDNRVGWSGRFHFHDGQPTPISYTGFNHLTLDAFGPVNPDNLGHLIMTNPAVYNNSTHGMAFFVIRMRENMANQNGRLNWKGYTTRYGLDASPACTAPALDCVPMSLENVPAIRRIDVMFNNAVTEYDTSPDGVSWIEYPN